MFTRTIWLRYRCAKCQSGQVERKHVDPTPITHINRLATEWSKNIFCAKCLNPLVIVDFECILIEGVDEYGNAMNFDFAGHWACNLGHIEPIYPIPLKRIITGDLITHCVNFQKYILVAKGGYPWKCPVCRAPLSFVDDSVIHEH